jgi:hypothetical protein
MSCAVYPYLRAYVPTMHETTFATSSIAVHFSHVRYTLKHVLAMRFFPLFNTIDCEFRFFETLLFHALLHSKRARLLNLLASKLFNMLYTGCRTLLIHMGQGPH